MNATGGQTPTNGCGSCSAAVASDHRFCGDCGRAVRVACGYCGATVPFRRYCAQCGLLLRRSLLQLGSQASPLAPAEAAPAGVTSIERLHDAAVEGAVQRNPPPTDLTAKIRAAGSDIVGERRKVVVLFSDVSGFTAMSEKMDPEEVHEIMNECFTGLVEVIYRYEGYIDKFIGDCIMALFGAPLAHEDDVARALLASLDMEAWLAEYSDKLERRVGVGLGMHSGVNYGTVVAGALGSDLRMDYTVIGDTVNVASRLESAAQRGETFVSETVHAVGRRQFEFREVEPLTLKGKERPVPAFALVAVRDDPDPVRGVDEFERVLVGRDAEAAVLHDAGIEALAGRGRVVSIVGEPGVGKSRLVSEFMRHLPDDAARCLRASCLSYTTRVPYYLFRELFRAWTGAGPMDESDVVATELRAAVDAAGRGLRQWEPYLRAFMSPTDIAATEPIANVDPQTRQRLTDRAILETVRVLAQDAPLILTCDDLHWIDEASERVLGHLVRQVGDTPLLVLAIYRQEFDPDWPSAPWTQAPLSTLGDADARELVSALLGGVELPAGFVDIVCGKSNGNPYFIEEVLRSFSDSGVIALRDGVWAIERPPEAADVPDALQAVIMGRLDSTPDTCRRIMQVASVVGPEFGSDMLADLGYPIAAAAPDLEYLVSLGLLAETQPMPEQRHAFRQDFVRDVCYETMLRSARRELHGEVADALQRLSGGGASPALLLDHSVKANRWVDGVGFALRSAAEARDVYANRSAAAYYEQAADLTNNAAEDDDTYAGARDRIAAQEGLGAVRSTMGEYEESMAAYETMLEAAAELSESAPDEARVRRAEALRSFANVHARRGEYDDALARLRECLVVLDGETSADATRERSNAEGRMAFVHFQRGEYDLTRELSRRSQEDADSVDAAPEAAFANLVWGLASYRQGDNADARARFDTSLQTRERIGDTNGVAAVLQNLANLCVDQNDWVAAETHFARCLDIRRKVGDVAGTANALNGLGNVYLGRADYDCAAATFGECLDIFEEISAGFGIAVATLNLGQIETERGDLTLALEYLARAHAAAQPLKARDLLTDIRAAEARAYAEASLWEDAADAADDALAAAREIANPGIEAKALWAQAAVALAKGDSAASLDNFGKSVEAARGADLKRWEARSLLGRALAAEAVGDAAASSADLAAAVAAFGDHTPQRDLDGIRALGERLSS
jgi:class 3 adenylate cyclase/tetratricopeptide (TPR) repeat protein